MKRNLKLMLFIAGCLMATGSYAQKVVVENGKVIIDASALRNITKEPKARETDGTDTREGTNDKNNIGSKVSNDKVYYRFEISKENGSSISWKHAVDQCKSLSTDGGGWRLPTQRELLLMYLLKQELEMEGAGVGFPVFDSTPRSYWSATEHNSDNARVVSFRNGTIINGNKYYIYYAYWLRCIRDITP